MTEAKPLFKQNIFQISDDWNWSIYIENLNLDTTGYTLTYVFKKQGINPIIVVSSSVSGNVFTFSVSNAITSLYKPGTYITTAFLTDNNGIKTTLGYSEAIFKADLSAEGVNDPRSHNRKALADVEKCLAEGAGSDVSDYTIGGSTVKLDRKGLLELRAFYLHRVRLEDGKPAVGTVLFNL